MERRVFHTIFFMSLCGLEKKTEVCSAGLACYNERKMDLKGESMVLLEIDTEQKLSEIVQKEANAAQNADPSKIKSFLEGLVPEIVSLGIQILLAIVIYFVGIKLIKFLRKRIRNWLMKLGFDTGVIQFLDSLIKIIAYFVLVCVILGLFGIQTTSIIAVLTSASLAAGLALQGSCTSLLQWLTRAFCGWPLWALLCP